MRTRSTDSTATDFAPPLRPGIWYAQCFRRSMEGMMGANSARRKPHKNFLDIPTAASQAGYSARHFRRIIEDAGIPVLQIGRKFFIVSRDFEAWKSTRSEEGIQESIQQLDGWVQKNPKQSANPADGKHGED
jgi:hypothetical protein